MKKRKKQRVLTTKEAIPSCTRRGDFFYFGEYPQTIKEEQVIINDNVVDERGYYLGSDGYFYAAWTVERSSLNKFSDGQKIVDGETYYFKVQPVRWRILKEKRGEAILLCDSILLSRRFDKSSSNYLQSEIRGFLNGDFYDALFNEEEKSLVLPSNIESKAKNAKRASEDGAPTQEDYVFLLSAREASVSDYRLLVTPTCSEVKKIELSDYALAQGLSCESVTGYLKGDWWLRSTGGEEEGKAHYIDGYTLRKEYYLNYFTYKENLADVSDATKGIVPATKVRFLPDVCTILDVEEEIFVDATQKSTTITLEYLYLGERAATIKSPDVTIDESTKNEQGNYLGSDGCYYRLSGPAYHTKSFSEFSDGTPIVDNQNYYFKVEPIRWQILEKKGNTALLICDSIIDTVLDSPNGWFGDIADACKENFLNYFLLVPPYYYMARFQSNTGNELNRLCKQIFVPQEKRKILTKTLNPISRYHGRKLYLFSKEEAEKYFFGFDKTFLKRKVLDYDRCFSQYGIDGDYAMWMLCPKRFLKQPWVIDAQGNIRQAESKIMGCVPVMRIHLDGTEEIETIKI